MLMIINLVCAYCATLESCKHNFMVRQSIRRGKGAVTPVKKNYGGLAKIICSCDGEPSSIASIII